MKKYLLNLVVLFGLLNPIGAIAQNDSTIVQEVKPENMSKKEYKEYVKKQKAKNDSIAHAEAVAAINKGLYLLIVDKTMKKTMTPEDSRRNFFLVENKKVMVQSGKAGESSGNNNMGGYSVISEIVGDIKTVEKKNGEVKSEFSLMSAYLSGKVNVKLDKKTNYGEVGILQSGNGQYAVMFGHIIPFEPSMVGSIIEVGKLFTPDGWDPFTLGAKRDVGVLMDYISGRR